ncbi:MAG: secondary thiamine-phosphate synthase enzyme YjbQ [Candidatus Thermoplasmatota archaeon]
MIKLKVKTNSRTEMADITDKIEKAIKEEGFEDGEISIYVPHTTAAVTINEGADPSVQRDIITTLQKLVPENGDYKHAEGNSDAHIKASIIGSSERVIVENGRLVLGTWQKIFFFEGDGPRSRKIYVEMFSK